MLEIGGNVGTAIAGIFTDLIAKIKDMILHPIKTLKSAATNIVDKGSGFIAGVTGFFAKKEDEYNEKQGDPSTDLAPAVAVARLKELRTTDTTGFNEDQQAVLGALKDALADAKTDEDKLRIAKLFQDYKIQENEMGTEGLFSDEFKKEQARLFSENRNNTGAQMERGMGEIADSKSQPTTVVVSDASSPQTTTVNNSTTTNVSGSAHQDESLPLIASAVPAGAW